MTKTMVLYGSSASGRTSRNNKSMSRDISTLDKSVDVICHDNIGTFWSEWRCIKNIKVVLFMSGCNDLS